ncbi:putative glycosyl transferase, family 14, beta-glucuronosyltransferase GlcAT14A/B/C [Helianthus annuus]|nr:putative glycosyl transferase, family 14, beta-glucuronosyltransferase GlcAT14A/B/C [Helianthus annuus]KAJ0589675.1 putative glycosyl transferase, family 14 [Helianthus annuus]KAJ0758267.1 putative glycosyl transferase, family 14, beta-glucuronosyltransferase GlcAT14A/B/C [Helianthus annuus]KAJ0761928.1 putative glycosyl transferase, family 14, beta-glucuronosyltransferase GlcAT14A/B/C [Helianthus annuus]KAJ0932038.1 putative glycosyl transferase, family 14 [Helianthus annuus]
MVANTLHAAAILLKEGGDWDWFINLSASDYPIVTQDDIVCYCYRMTMISLGMLSREGGLGKEIGKKTNTLFITLRRYLVYLFLCKRLQMWSADCTFTSEKTNTT